MSFMEIGFQSYKDLSSAFVTTLVGGTSLDQLAGSGRSGVSCWASQAGNHTVFYLDPFVSSSEGDSCAGTDWVVILILTLVIHTISWWSRWLLWEPFGNWRMRDVAWKHDECRRFSMTCTSCMFFTLSALFANRVLRSKEWLFDRHAWTEREPLVDADFKFYYLLYAARFFSDLVSIFFESRSADAFVAALIHHLTTLALVLSSAYVGHIRFGGIIMFFFDWADIPLLAAKCFKYLSTDPTDSFEFVAKRLFEVFAVMFLATRVIYFNYIVYCAMVDLSYDWVNRTCQCLLVVLVCLQTYWMSLIINALVRVFTNGSLVDQRDEDLNAEPIDKRD